MTGLKSENTRLDRFKIWVEIFAIIIGGLWVLFTFVIKDDPSLHGSSKITSAVTVDYVNCKMHISCFVTIKNNSKTAFKVTEPVCIKVWLIPINALTKGTYFDWEQYMFMFKNQNSVPEIKDTVFEEYYAPGDSLTISHDFFINRPDDDSVKYTIVAKASTMFRFQSFVIFHTTKPDYAYDVKIRYKIIDLNSVPRPNAKQPGKDDKPIKRAALGSQIVGK
jgi:hypothetical protein